LVVVLLFGGASVCAAAPGKPLLFGHVYVFNGRSTEPYKGRLPFKILWPHETKLQCFAEYFPSRPSKAPPTRGGAAAPGSGYGIAPVNPVSPFAMGGKAPTNPSPSSGQKSAVVATAVAVPPTPYVDVACPIHVNPTTLLSVLEFRANALKQATAGIKPFRLDGYRAYAGTVQSQGNRRIDILYVRHDKVGVELQGLVPMATLKAIARSLRD
jgi:hypothetical protein